MTFANLGERFFVGEIADDIWPDGRPVDSESTGADIKLEDEHVEFLVPA